VALNPTDEVPAETVKLVAVAVIPVDRLLADEVDDVPTALVAAIVNVYPTFEFSPLNKYGLDIDPTV
jgi:hypothetical protein